MKDVPSSIRLSHNSEIRRLMCQFAVIGPLAVAATALVGQQTATAEAPRAEVHPSPVDYTFAQEAQGLHFEPFLQTSQRGEYWTVASADERVIETVADVISGQNSVYIPFTVKSGELIRPENEIWAEHLQKVLKEKLGITVDQLTIDKVFLDRLTPANLDAVITAITNMFGQVDSSVQCFKTHIPKLSFEPTPDGIKGARTGHIYNQNGDLTEIKVQFTNNAPFEYEGKRNPTGGVGLFANELLHVVSAHITKGDLYGQGPYRGFNAVAEAVSSLAHDIADVNAGAQGLPANQYNTEKERAGTDHFADTGIFTEITDDTLPSGIASFVIGSLDQLHNLPLHMFTTLVEAIGIRLSYEFAKNGVTLRELLETQTHVANKEFTKIPQKVRTILDKFVSGGLIAGPNTPTFPEGVAKQIAMVRRRPEAWIFERPDGSEVTDMFQVDIATLKIANGQMNIGTGIGSDTWVLGEWTNPADNKVHQGGVSAFVWQKEIPGTTLFDHQVMLEPHLILPNGTKVRIDSPDVQVTLHTKVENTEYYHRFKFAKAPAFNPNSRPPTPIIN